MVPKKGQGSGSGQGCSCGDTAGGIGKGPPSRCGCSACGHEVPHAPGVPCRQVRCPRCGAIMSRIN